jgi:esterase
MTADPVLSELDHLRLALEIAGMQVPEVVLPTSHHVLLRNHRFHYLDWGGRGSIPVVFLHGGGLTAHTWDLVCLALRPHYRCFALDLRGHGDSEWSSGMVYSIDEHARDVDAFVTTIGLRAPCVVGMSLGGMTAARYSIDHTPRALVVVDTGPASNRAGGRAIIDFMRQPAELDSVDEFVARSLAFNPRRDPRLLRRSLLNNLMQLPDGKWTWKYDRRHYGRLDEMQQDEYRRTLWERADRIACPVLVVRGGDSPVFPRDSAERFARMLPNGRMAEIAGAGHTVQGDNPADLSTELLKFLREALN